MGILFSTLQMEPSVLKPVKCIFDIFIRISRYFADGIAHFHTVVARERMDLEDVIWVCLLKLIRRNCCSTYMLRKLIVTAMFWPNSPNTDYWDCAQSPFRFISLCDRLVFPFGVHDLRHGDKTDLVGPPRDVDVAALACRFRVIVCKVYE